MPLAAIKSQSFCVNIRINLQEINNGYKSKQKIRIFVFLLINSKTDSIMSDTEQQAIREKYYAEALRCMDNAKETLKKANKESNYYSDKKYVRTACGTAYNGVLLALDAYLLTKGVRRPRGRKSIEYYQNNIGQADKKMLNHLNSVYEVLHLAGYYDGVQDARILKIGFDTAYDIIEKIKPQPAS
jgi:uncharacterized protein (UPF0332 family)